MGPLSAEEEHCQAQPPCGPCFRSRRKSRVVFVGSVCDELLPCVFLAIVCVRDPHVFCGEKDSTNTTSKSLTREQHKRRFVCIIQWMGLNLSKSRQQGLSVAYSTPPQIQLVWKGSESIHIRIIIEYALSRSYRLTRNAYQPRSLPLAMDSNLEAFSYYPTDGSFAPSAFQPSALPII